MSRRAVRLPRLIALAALIALAQGCALRGRPPECKGPYTPINSPLTVSSDGTQR